MIVRLCKKEKVESNLIEVPNMSKLVFFGFFPFFHGR